MAVLVEGVARGRVARAARDVAGLAESQESTKAEKKPNEKCFCSAEIKT